jgi:hypothetical protein
MPALLRVYVEDADAAFVEAIEPGGWVVSALPGTHGWDTRTDLADAILLGLAAGAATNQTGLPRLIPVGCPLCRGR